MKVSPPIIDVPRNPDTLVLTAPLAFRFSQSFFQLSQLIAGNILSALGFRPRAEILRGLISAFRVFYTVAERSHAVDILAVHRNWFHKSISFPQHISNFIVAQNGAASRDVIRESE